MISVTVVRPAMGHLGTAAIQARRDPLKGNSILTGMLRYAAGSNPAQRLCIPYVVGASDQLALSNNEAREVSWQPQ